MDICFQLGNVPKDIPKDADRYSHPGSAAYGSVITDIDCQCDRLESHRSHSSANVCEGFPRLN